MYGSLPKLETGPYLDLPQFAPMQLENQLNNLYFSFTLAFRAPYYLLKQAAEAGGLPGRGWVRRWYDEEVAALCRWGGGLARCARGLHSWTASSVLHEHVFCPASDMRQAPCLTCMETPQSQFPLPGYTN